MMNKFKKGDKVKLRQSSKHIALKGKVFTVRFAHSFHVFCVLDGREHIFKPFVLEIINE